MNDLDLTAPVTQWPQQIMVEPARLSIGLWGYPKGDIAQAYCADRFPRLRAFFHEGHHYANLSGGEHRVNAYPLIPARNYRGPQPQQYNYEGRSARWNGLPVILGPEVVFACRERTLDEWTDRLRRIYAYGGWFASGKTYAELLAEFLSDAPSAGKADAIRHELAQASLPITQEEMRQHIETPKAAQISQLQLGFTF